jgi:RNA polymerase sigma-70 factor (ECF subfamily)
MYSSNKNAGDRKFVLEDIKKALSTLSEDYYIPFTMYYEGYKYREIAIELDLPIGTIKTRIHVARKSLQNELLAYSNKLELPIFA